MSTPAAIRARLMVMMFLQFFVWGAWWTTVSNFMANVTLGIVCHNFGVQEYSPFNANTQEIFKGCPEMKNGYLYVNETPGWGIEVDEQAAARFPFGREQGVRGQLNGGWGELRRRDGTIIKQ